MPAYTPITAPSVKVERAQSTTGTRKNLIQRFHLTAYTFILPFFLVFIAFRLYPFVLGILTSFTNARIGPRPPEYIGLENYIAAIGNGEVQRAFMTTFNYAIIVVPMTFFISLGMAVYVNQKLPTNTFSRVVFFAPYVLAVSIVAIIWNWMFQTQFGLVNVGLGLLGLPDRTPWLAEADYVLPVIAFITTWWQAGFSMVIFLAALQDIPQELTEASRIDGANPWQTFWRVVFPLLRPASTLVITISLIEAMRVFSLMHIVTRGGPGDSSTSVVLYIFREGFTRFEQGSAAAIGVLLFIVIMALTALRALLLRGNVRYF